MATPSSRSAELVHGLENQVIFPSDNKQSLLYVKKGYIFGGYSLHLLKECLPSYFKGFMVCSSCEGLLREACGVGDPQVFMCLFCAQERDSIVLKPNREAVDNLVLVCPLKSRGCAWEGKVSESEAHLDECEFFRIDCELFCGIVVERKSMEIHLIANCPLREIKCEHCGLSHKEKETNIHLGWCDEFPLQCPYQCGGVIKRKLKRHHVDQECENTVLECPYKEYGCEVKIARKEMEEHMSENRLLHLELKTELLCEQIQFYKNENLSLKKEVSMMKHFLSSFEEKWIVIIDNVSKIGYNPTPITNFMIPNDSHGKIVKIYISCHKTWRNKFVICVSARTSEGDLKTHEISSQQDELASKQNELYRSQISLSPGLNVFSTEQDDLSSQAESPTTLNEKSFDPSWMHGQQSPANESFPYEYVRRTPKLNTSEIPQYNQNHDINHTSLFFLGQIIFSGLSESLRGYYKSTKVPVPVDPQEPKLASNGCIVIINQSDQIIHSKQDFSLNLGIKNRNPYGPRISSNEVLVEFDLNHIMHPDVCVNDTILTHVYYNRQLDIPK